jgi:hypothetical protein
MKFRSFDQASMAATRKAWREDALKGAAFLPDVEQQLDWAEKHIELTEHEVAYGVFKDGAQVASAICELCITRPSVRGKWVKFMRLRLRPSIDVQLFEHKPAAGFAAVEAYIACVIGVFHLKNELKATTIKVYGRTQQQISFLTILSAALEKRDGLSFKSSIEGRWLVLNWKKS